MTSRHKLLAASALLPLGRSLPCLTGRCRDRPRHWMSKAGIEKNHTAMLFPGQGAQYVGMGRDLYDTYPAARRVFDEAAEVLGFKLVDLVFDGHQDKLRLTENAQPAILATSMAMVRVLEEHYGMRIEDECTYAMGHSLGEYTALVATRSLSLADAVKLLRARGKAMQNAVANVSTSMAALVMRQYNIAELEEAMKEVQKELPDGELVELANINSSFQVVISGTTRAVDIASRYLQHRHLAARAVDLPVSTASHCSLMESAAEEVKKQMAGIEFKMPVVQVVANVTAKPIKDPSEIPSLLIQQITKTVQWHKSIKYLKDHDIDDFVVYGPGRVLANLLKREHPLDCIRPVTNAETIQEVAKAARCYKHGKL